MLLSCSLDYSLAVLLPEAGLTDLERPDRKALCVAAPACPHPTRPHPPSSQRAAPLSAPLAPAHASRSAASLGLDATGEEPLLAQLVRERMQGGRAKPQSPRADAAASDAAAAALPTPQAGGGSSLGVRDLPPLGKPSAGGPLGDLPPLGGRPRGADDELEEERRLDAIESKLGKLAGMPLTAAQPATAPAQSRAQVPHSQPSAGPAATGGDDFEDDELIEEDFDDDFEDDIESDELSVSASQQSAPLVAGGLGSLSASLQASRTFDRSVDESMDESRLNRELQGFDHTEEVEPLRAAPSVPPLQPRSSGPSLAPLQTPRGASSQPQAAHRRRRAPQPRRGAACRRRGGARALLAQRLASVSATCSSYVWVSSADTRYSTPMAKSKRSTHSLNVDGTLSFGA